MPFLYPPAISARGPGVDGAERGIGREVEDTAQPRSRADARSAKFIHTSFRLLGNVDHMYTVPRPVHDECLVRQHIYREGSQLLPMLICSQSRPSTGSKTNTIPGPVCGARTPMTLPVWGCASMAFGLASILASDSTSPSIGSHITRRYLLKGCSVPPTPDHRSSKAVHRRDRVGGSIYINCGE